MFLALKRGRRLREAVLKNVVSIQYAAMNHSITSYLRNCLAGDERGEDGRAGQAFPTLRRQHKSLFGM